MSYPLTVLGTPLKTRSPLFNAWGKHVHSQLSGDVPGAALGVSLSPFLAGIYYFTISALVTIGMLTFWHLMKRRDILIRIIAIAIGVVLVIAFWRVLTATIGSFRWLFYVLATGELMLAVGIFFGLITPLITEETI
ncbi:MAG: hypothetical protein AAGI69_13900 [Cyanobacteria bacterium P01_H01_bin.21]